MVTSAKLDVFLSFDIEHDDAERLDFISKIANSARTFSVTQWSSPARSPHSDWDKLDLAKVERCDLVIVLVGKDTAAAVNVDREIGFAKQKNVPYFGVYVGGANESVSLPARLPTNRTIPCDWQRISAAIDQLMSEGKNHVFR